MADILEKVGKLTFLRAHDVGTKYGPPTDELDVPPPADVPPVPIVELDCAIASAAVPARNVAVSAASVNRLIGCLLNDC